MIVWHFLVATSRTHTVPFLRSFTFYAEEGRQKKMITSNSRIWVKVGGCSLTGNSTNIPPSAWLFTNYCPYLTVTSNNVLYYYQRDGDRSRLKETASRENWELHWRRHGAGPWMTEWRADKGRLLELWSLQVYYSQNYLLGLHAYRCMPSFVSSPINLGPSSSPTVLQLRRYPS